MSNPYKEQQTNGGLLQAISEGALPEARELASRATNLVNPPGAHRHTALIWAAAYGSSEIARFLLPLSRWDDTAVVIRGDNLWRALDTRSSIEGADFRSAYVADDGARLVDALALALFNGQTDTVKTIAEHIPIGHFHRPEHADAAGELLWMAVAHQGAASTECLRWMLSLIDFAQTPVDADLALREAARQQRPDLLSMLLPKADLRARSRQGITPLMLACGPCAEGAKDSGRCAQMLIEAGCDLDARDIIGRNAAAYAVAVGGPPGLFAGGSTLNVGALDILGAEILNRARGQRLDGLQTLRAYGIRPNLSEQCRPPAQETWPRICAGLEATALEIAASRPAEPSAKGALAGLATDPMPLADARPKRL